MQLGDGISQRYRPGAPGTLADTLDLQRGWFLDGFSRCKLKLIAGLLRCVSIYIYITYLCMYVCMYGCMYGCMYVCTDGWMYGCMDDWMYGCMDVCMHACVYVYTHISHVWQEIKLH